MLGLDFITIRGLLSIIGGYWIVNSAHTKICDEFLYFIDTIYDNVLYNVSQKITAPRTMRMVNSSESRKIMTKPLPQILDEIEDSIRSADEAAKNAREATAGALKAGEKAANEAVNIMNERIVKVE